MAISHISVGDVETISKLNQSIDRSNEVEAARSGSASLGDRLGVILDTSLGQSDNVLNYLNGVIAGHRVEAEATAAEVVDARAGSPTIGDRIQSVLDWSNSQDTAQNNYFNGVIAGHRSDAEATKGEVVAARLGASTLSARVALLRAGDVTLASGNSARPGIVPEFFSNTLTGSPTSISGFATTRAVASSDGPVVMFATNETIASAAAFRVEPGRFYRVRFIVRRTVDAVDPANDAVRLSMNWLDSSFALVSTTVLSDIVDLDVGSGRVEMSFTLSRNEGDEIDVVSPANAVFCRPSVKSFGEAGTALELMEVVDLSDSIEYAPDVTTLLFEMARQDAQIRALTDRLDALEA